MALITMAQANDHLRLDLENDGGSPIVYTDARTPNVAMKIVQAESIVLNYLKIDEPHDPNASPQIWTEADLIVVQSAALLILSALFDDAQGRTVEDYMKAHGTVPLLLVRLRDPALA